MSFCVILRIDGPLHRIAPLPLAIARCVSRASPQSAAVNNGTSARLITTDRIFTLFARDRKEQAYTYLRSYSLPRPTLFSMSTTRAFLPRPAASYTPHVVVILEKLLSYTSHSRHWGISTRIADGIERRESRRRRTSCDQVDDVAPINLR